MTISGYFKLNYRRLLMAIGRIILLMAIGGYSIGGYFKLNYHKLLVVINGYYISGGYFINGYWWLLY
jgi:hypothetical protein